MVCVQSNLCNSLLRARNLGRDSFDPRNAHTRGLPLKVLVAQSIADKLGQLTLVKTT
jgi:hypothetical protein